jgi:hypothetical protein
MIVQFVKFPSSLTDAEVERIMNERAPQFRQLSGLIQKFYGRERETGELCGIYLWETEEALATFRASELARSIPTAYQVSRQPRVETFDVIMPLRPLDVAATARAD